MLLCWHFLSETDDHRLYILVFQHVSCEAAFAHQTWTSKVKIIHLTASTPGAFEALGFDPQLSQTAAHCFISLSYLPIPSTVLQKPYSDCWSLSLKEMTIRFL